MVGQGGFELADLAVQLGDDADGGAGGRREGAVTLAGTASCLVPSAARISRARAAILRCRPPRLSADWIAVRLSRAPCSGRGTPAQHPEGVAVGEVLKGHRDDNLIGRRYADEWSRSHC